MRVLGRVFPVAVVAAALAGCDIDRTPIAAADLSPRARAYYENAIRDALPKAKDARPLTEIAPRRLGAHPEALAILTRLGYVERRGSRYAFTAKGRSSSADCYDAANPGCRIFRIGYQHFEKLETLNLVGADPFGIGGVDCAFTSTIVAEGPLGTAFARAGVLHFDDGRPWFGLETVVHNDVTVQIFAATGSIESLAPQAKAEHVIDAFDVTPELDKL